MIKYIFFFIIYFNCCLVFSQERLKIEYDDDEVSVNDLMSSVKEAIDNADIKSYASLHTKEFDKNEKRRMAIMFMQDKVKMYVENARIIESDKDHIEFIAKYSLTFGDKNVNIISSVLAKKINRKLLIEKEEIILRNGQEVDCSVHEVKNKEVARKNKNNNNNFDDRIKLPQFIEPDEDNPFIVPGERLSPCMNGRCEK